MLMNQCAKDLSELTTQQQPQFTPHSHLAEHSGVRCETANERHLPKEISAVNKHII